MYGALVGEMLTKVKGAVQLEVTVAPVKVRILFAHTWESLTGFSYQSVVPLEVTVTLLVVVVSKKLDVKGNRVAHHARPAATVRLPISPSIFFIAAGAHTRIAGGGCCIPG
jgi:hypothetical protein